MRLRIVLVLLSAVTVVVVTVGAWFVAVWLADPEGRTDEGLSLKKSNIVTEADRYQYLPFVVAQDDRILKLLDRPDDPIRVDLANRYLETVNRSARSHDLFVLNATVRCRPRCNDVGTTLASSNWRDDDSRVGINYGYRVYFKDAVARGEGRLYAIGATSGIPGYYLAHRVETPAGSVGVVVVKVHLSQLEDAWREAGEHVGLIDSAGMIFLSSVEGRKIEMAGADPARKQDEDWKYRPLYPLSKEDRQRLLKERQYPSEFLDRPPLRPERELKPGQTFDLPFQGGTIPVRLLDIPSHGWRVLAALDMAPVYDAAKRDTAYTFLVAALLVAAGFYLHERRERVQADRLRTILEDMSIGIAVFDPNLRLVAWNSPYIRLNSYPETLVRANRPLAEIIEHSAQRGDYGSGDPKQQVQMRLDRVRQQPVRQTEVRRADGTWLDMRHSRTSEGWIVRTYSDITERKQAEAELNAHRTNLEGLVQERTAELVRLNDRLRETMEQTEAAKRQAEQADKAKTTFLNSVSHDIRNPLNAILGYAALVLANAKDGLPQKQYDNLRKLEAKGRELNELVHDFLDYTRADHVTIKEFALAPLIQQCIATIEPMIGGRPIALSCDMPDHLPTLHQDEQKLKRIIWNLLNNAAKFTECGNIRLAVQCRDEAIDITVADTGIGIAKEFQDRIFEEFQRVEPRGERPREGTGLGLAICRRFATLMTGTLSVKSTLGSGSAFTLSIPLAHPQAPTSQGYAAAPMPATGDRVAAPRDGRATILVVDDSKENRDFLAQLLEKDYRILLAENGRKALDMTKAERPDLILMDLSLPIMDGWTATRLIKSDPMLRAIPVIVVTAHATVQDREDVEAAGCDEFLSKPIDEAVLLEILHRYLGKVPDG